MNPKQVLQDFFGYDKFRSGQEEIISSILNGENVLAILPTGGGKSLCYQIPALLSSSFAVVISPLIALMKDQVDNINKIQPTAAFINSSLDSRAVEKVLNDISARKIKLLYISPERLNNQFSAERIKKLSPSFLFVDEAHCISEWGHNFRPSYRKIKEFIEFIGVKSVSAFTATATEEVRKDIVNQLGLVNPNIFVRGFARANLYLNVIQTTHKKEKVVELLSNQNGSSIVYTSTRKNAEDAAEFLRINKIDAVYYHAGLTTELRRIIQDDFLSGRVKTIIATNAFGMGIDKSDIRTIIHFNMPNSIENFYQEIGRAGRDGKDSNIFLLYEDNDRAIQEYFINSSNPTREQIEIIYNAVCDYGKVAVGNVSQKGIAIDSNFNSLLVGKNISTGLLDSSIRVLEESGYLKRKSEFEKKHFGQFLLEPNKLKAYIKNFAGDSLKDLVIFLARVHGAKIFASKTQLNIKNACEQIDLSEADFSEQLKQLSRIGIFDYDAPLQSPAVMLNRERVNSADLRLNLERVRNITDNSRAKLEKMIGYVFTNECRTKYILDYFGEDAAEYQCGKCDKCTGSISQNQNLFDYLEEIILQTVHEAVTPIKKKTLFQILTGETDFPSLKKFSTFASCTHFKKEELGNTLQSLCSTKFLLNSNDVYSLSEKGIEKFASTINLPSVHSNETYEDELKLFNLLRQSRKEAAEKFGQSQNLVCPDEILRVIAKEKPKTHTGLLNINGFNRRMLNKVGDEFLNIINENVSSSELNVQLKKKKLPENVLQILELVQKKYSLADISSLAKLPEAIVSSQIETLLELSPELEIDFLFEKKELALVYKKIDAGVTDIKLLREELENKISYAKLRIALAKKRVS